jgi:inorganic triphosphatase YgiF
MTTANIETEAKFAIPDKDTFVALQNTRQLGNFQLKPVEEKNVIDRYLDVADRRLFKAGYACRIRAAKQKQTLTLKSLTPAEGNIHRRQEIEMEVESDQPEEWPEGQAKDLVYSIIGQKTLETLFILHQIRQKYNVYHHGLPVIELSLDEVFLGDAGTVDYFELEAELIETGNEDDLTRFVEALRASWPLQPESKSKFERALAKTNL